MASSASVSSSPPLSGSDPTLARTDTRSSAGAFRRSSATPIRYSHISIWYAARCSSVCSTSPGITASDQSKKRGHCDPSTPSSSQITRSGNGMERSCTTSNGLAALDLIQERRCLRRHPGLHQPHHRRLEARLHQSAVAGVLWRVGVHHGRRRLVGRADLVGQDAAGRAERPRVGADVRHLGMGRDGPEAAALVVDPAHGRRPTELGIQGEGVAAGVQRSDRAGGRRRRSLCRRSMRTSDSDDQSVGTRVALRLEEGVVRLERPGPVRDRFDGPVLGQVQERALDDEADVGVLRVVRRARAACAPSWPARRGRSRR